MHKEGGAIIKGNNEEILKMEGIHKYYPGVHALKGVDFDLKKGEVCAILGENGAGKSTLMNVLGGVVQNEEGSIYLAGRKVNIKNTKEAKELGIAFIHQELSLFRNMDVATNICIQKLPNTKGFLAKRQLYKKTAEILKIVKLEHCKPEQKVGELKIGEQQLVEIGRCLAQDIKVLILDEPTSSLTASEIEVLFEIVRRLKEKGTAIVFITHRMDEIYEICDTMMIMRDGSRIMKCGVHDILRPEVVNSMLGQAMEEQYSHQQRNPGEEILEVKGLTRKNKLNQITFSVRKGEMLGLYGLLGSGRTEVLRSIFGLDPYDAGEVIYKGKRLHIKSPRDAIAQNMAMVTEDRHLEGLVLDRSVKFNISLANLKSIRRNGLTDGKKETDMAKQGVEELNIKTPTVNRAVKFLSGGNQQKVVISKWLHTKPDLLLLDEPTRGIDIGAKREIYMIVDQLLARGVAVIMVSSELPEILGLCDRVIVLKEGQQVMELGQEDGLNGNKLLEAAMGGAK